MILIITLGFAVIPSLVFSNFWKKKIFENFLFLDLESLQILYNATRIKQMYGGLNINKKILSSSSDITAPWTKDYKTINFKHNTLGRSVCRYVIFLLFAFQILVSN